MNVALISREYPPFFGGGIGSYTVRIARTLAERNHRPIVITVSNDGAERRENDDGVTVIRLPFLAGDDWSAPHPAIATPERVEAFRAFNPVSVFAMQVARAMPALAREFALDAIEAPDTGALAWFLLNARRTAAAGYHSLPSITTVIHSPSAWIAHWNRSPLKGRAQFELAWMERDQARWSDALVCPSTAVADWAEANWDIPRERIAVIRNPLGELESLPAPHSAAAAPESPPIILFSGRLEPRKGIDTLLEAFVHLCTGSPASPAPALHLAGQDTPDPDRPGLFGCNTLSRVVPPALRDGVRAEGKLTQTDLSTLLTRAAVVAIPSPMDNLPYTCVEAMAHGKVVVAAGAGGVSELIEDGVSGILFTPGDPAACAGALRRALSMSPEDARRMGAEAGRRIALLCGNDGVATARIEQYTRARVSPRPPTGAPRDVVVVNTRHVPRQTVDRLARAVREGGGGDGIDFAHGWTSHDGRARVYSTPTLESLSLAPRAIGPIALTRTAAEDPRLAPFLTRRRSDDALTCDSPWALAALLAACGYRGAVVPEAVIDTPPTSLEEPELASLHRAAEDLKRLASTRAETIAELRAELNRIKSSRGWSLLQRLYAVLHVLKGRGLRRAHDYHRPEESRPEPGPAGRNQIA